jgi:hypothetical protein
MKSWSVKHNIKLFNASHGLTAAHLFQWRKVYLQGSLVEGGANEIVVLAAEPQEVMLTAFKYT